MALVEDMLRDVAKDAAVEDFLGVDGNGTGLCLRVLALGCKRPGPDEAARKL